MTAPHRAVLALPGFRVQVCFGLIAQITQQVAPIGILLLIHAKTGSLPLAGLVTAAFSAGVATGRPLQGHAMGRASSRPVMLAAGMLHLGALIGLIAVATVRPSGWLLVGLGWLVGLGLPPISSGMRIEWGLRVPPEARTAAYSLVHLTQELAVLIGPLLLGALIWAGSVPLALLALASAATIGTIGFAWTLHTKASASGTHHSPAVLRSPGMRALLAVVAAMGGVFGALEVGIPAVASATGHRAATGPLVAALSLGGILGAAAYGARGWSAPPIRRLIGLLLVLGAILAPLAVIGFLPVTGIVLLAGGAALNPAAITISLVVDEMTATSVAAFGWTSTALAVGASAGNAIAGVVAGHGAAQTFLLAPLLAILAAALARAVPAGPKH